MKRIGTTAIARLAWPALVVLIACPHTSDSLSRCQPACAGSAPICNESTGECVGCLATSDCTGANASRCDSENMSCVPCEVNADCSHIEGKGVCDDGLCVECTAQDNSACEGGTKVCDSTSRECTDRDPHSKQACEACVADLDCFQGMLCVTEVFNEAELAPVCLWRQDTEEVGAPNGSCASNGRPYIAAESRTSIDGVETEVCTLALSTCLAHSQFRQQECSGETEQGHSECGEPDMSDAYCLQFGVGEYRCTVPCLAVDDCPVNVSGCIDPAPPSIPGKVCEL